MGRERAILIMALLTVSLGLALPFAMKDTPGRLPSLLSTRLQEGLASLRMGLHGIMGSRHHDGASSGGTQRGRPSPPPPPPRAPFGALLGVTHGGVEVFSCDYDNMTASSPPKGDNSWEGIWTGTRFQCVELARRYLVVNMGVTFESIDNAFQIFDLKHVERLSDSQHLLMTALPNGVTPSAEGPVIGSLIIWRPMGYYKGTGHVAVVVRVTDEFIEIVEQNVEDAVWPEGREYSRRLSVSVSAHGLLTLVDLEYGGANVIMGWMNIHTKDPAVAPISSAA